MQQFVTGRGRYAHQRNGRPTLEQLGLDIPTEVRRFEEYCSRFGLVRSQT
jgi:hypothetical protein